LWKIVGKTPGSEKENSAWQPEIKNSCYYLVQKLLRSFRTIEL
jgi:hypothetical protein